MIPPRQVLPELLDNLPHDDPAALRSRADLHRLNRLMGNPTWMKTALKRQLAKRSLSRIVELGAGDGALTRFLAGHFPELEFVALDLAPPPPDWSSPLGWCQGDVFVRLPELEPDLVIANLFLHHFENPDLTRLGDLLTASPARAILSVEPARLAYSRLISYASRILMINHVTWHDMKVSIGAGFRGEELPHALFPDSAAGWSSSCSYTPFGLQRTIAERES